jgi:hypothetical protein
MMDQLIAELEAAPEGSRGFDVRIEITRRSFLAGLGPAAVATEIARVKYQIGFAKFAEAEEVPNYTTSLDAARTFIPKGCVWSVQHGYADDGTDARVNSASVWHDDMLNEYPTGCPGDAWQAATVELALCLANCKAIQAMEAAP